MIFRIVSCNTVSRCFPKSFRLRTTRQYQNVFAVRHSAADHALILFATSNALPHCRLGLSVSKKVGNAVTRNRWKRLIREAFRNALPELPSGLDCVVLPQRNVDVQTIKSLESSLKNLTAKIFKRTTYKKKQTVLLTRPIHQAEPVKSQLEALGFQVLLQPAIDILPSESRQEMDEALRKLRQGEFDWLIFSSSNGIHSFVDRFEMDRLETDQPEHPHHVCPEAAGMEFNVRIAVVGTGTDSTLYQRLGRHADVVPKTFTAEAVAEALSAEAGLGKHFLHLRASRGRESLKRLLTEAGGNVTEIAVYRSVDRTQAEPEIRECMRQGRIDFVTVTSSAIAQSLVNLFGNLLRQTCLVSISPITSKTLRNLGFPPQKEASEASLAGIVDALRD